MLFDLLHNPAVVAVLITLAIRIWRTAAVQARVGASLPRLPRDVQWAAPVALALLQAAGQGYLDGLRGQALLEFVALQAGEVGTMAIGVWHTYKRLASQRPPHSVGAGEKPAKADEKP